MRGTNLTTRTRSTVPIFVGLSANKRDLEWRSVELAQNKAQNVERMRVADMTNVIESPQNSLTFEIVAGATTLKLDASRHGQRLWK